MESKMVKLPLATLVEDLTLYPRHTIDEQHVQKLVLALEAGETLPLPVIDLASRRIVDGWHRVRAWIRFLGRDGVIEVVTRSYASTLEMFMDAVRLNASHGRPLDKIDLVRVTLMAQELGASEVQIAAVLHRPEREVRKLSIRYATAPEGTEDVVPGTHYMTLKNPVMHLAGRVLTREQADALASVPGTSYTLLAHQLTDAVKYDLVDQEDQHLVAALRELRDTLLHFFEG